MYLSNPPWFVSAVKSLPLQKPLLDLGLRLSNSDLEPLYSYLLKVDSTSVNGFGTFFPFRRNQPRNWHPICVESSYEQFEVRIGARGFVDLKEFEKPKPPKWKHIVSGTKSFGCYSSEHILHKALRDGSSRLFMQQCLEEYRTQIAILMRIDGELAMGDKQFSFSMPLFCSPKIAENRMTNNSLSSFELEHSKFRTIGAMQNSIKRLEFADRTGLCSLL